MKRLLLGFAVVSVLGVAAACVGSDPDVFTPGPADGGGTADAPANPAPDAGAPGEEASAPVDSGDLDGGSITIANAEVFPLPVAVASFVPIAGSNGGIAYLAAGATTSDVTELSGDGGTLGVHHLAVPFTVASVKALNAYQGDYAIGGEVNATTGWAARFAMDGGANAAPTDSVKTSGNTFVDVAATETALIELVNSGQTYAVATQAVDGLHVVPVTGPGGASKPLLVRANELTTGASSSVAVVALNSPGAASPPLEVSVWARSNTGSKGFVQPTFFQNGNAVTVSAVNADPSGSFAFGYGSGLLLVFQTTSSAVKLSVIGNTTTDTSPKQLADADGVTLQAGLSTNNGDKTYIGGCQGSSAASVPWIARVGKQNAPGVYAFDSAFGTAGVRTFPELPLGSCVRQLREDDNQQIVALIATPAGFAAPSVLVRIPP